MILTKCGVFRCKLDQGMNGKDKAPLWAAAAPLPEIPCEPWDSPWDQHGQGDLLSHLLPAAGERKTLFFTLILSFIPNPPFLHIMFHVPSRQLLDAPSHSCCPAPAP